MTWTYTQDKGALRNPQGVVQGFGYSGNTWGLNNPAAQFQVGVGPIPVGLYTIGPPHNPIDHLGPLALPLWPDRANQMHGRSGFFAHGDNPALNHSASNGCIVLGHYLRVMLHDSTDRQLSVIATQP